MGENASATEGSKSSESDSTSSDTTTSVESTTTVQRTPDVPAAKGHGPEAGPDALGIDRLADQQRKRREENLGPATVRRMEQRGEIDREPSDFQREAADLASRISSDESDEVDRSAESSGDETATVQRSVEGEAASAGSSDGGGGPSSLVENVVSSSGTSLDPGIRGEMESKMGTSFGDVRVHTGKQAGKAAQAINAKAFTVGNHIGFNSGEYDTSSPEGKHTIAHELAHVKQQANQTQHMAQRIQEGSGLAVSDPKDPHEQEAERVARAVMRGESAEVSRLARTPVSPRVDRLSMPWNSDSGGGGGGGDEESLEERIKSVLGEMNPENLAKGLGGAGIAAGITLASGGTLGPALLAPLLGPMAGEMTSTALKGDTGSGLPQEKLNELEQRVAENEQQLNQVTEQIGSGGGQSGSGGGQGLAQSQQ